MKSAKDYLKQVGLDEEPFDSSVIENDAKEIFQAIWNAHLQKEITDELIGDEFLREFADFLSSFRKARKGAKRKKYEISEAERKRRSEKMKQYHERLKRGSSTRTPTTRKKVTKKKATKKRPSRK